MTPPDSVTSDCKFTQKEAIDFGLILFAESESTGIEPLRIFIFAAADTDCPLSYFRDASLVDEHKVICKIVGGGSKSALKLHLEALCCQNMGIVRKDKAGKFRINTTKPNEAEWRLLGDFRLALETEWIKKMYLNEKGIRKLRVANDEVDTARKNIIRVRASMHAKPSFDDLAEQRNHVHSFLSADTDFHLVGVQENAVAVAFLKVLLDRLQLDLTMSQRIENRIVGNEKKGTGSFFEHKQIIDLLETKNKDAEETEIRKLLESKDVKETEIRELLESKDVAEAVIHFLLEKHIRTR